MATTNIAAFLDFLSLTPDSFSNFLKIVSEWYKLQGKVPNMPSNDKPHEWKIGEEPVLTTVALSDEQITAFVDKYSDAVVKEKAIAFVRGFFMALSL